MKERDTSLDIMRFLGVLIIMIAHSNPPLWLDQLRNFGTPLLIVASALTISAIYKKREINSKKFFRKRVLRLTVPAWIFLTMFFFIVYVATLLLKRPYPFSIKEMVESYSFYEGIGYVWILKVYLILAFITPLALRFKSSISNSASYFSILIFCYIVYEVLVFTSQLVVPPNFSDFLNEVVFIIIPYSILFLYGLKLDELKLKQILLIAASSLGVFVFLAFSKFNVAGHFVLTQTDKYPPRIYYLSYAFFCLNITYLICKKILIKFIPANPVVWLSSNSLWIYLWHIMATYIWATVFSPKDDLLFSLINSIFILSFGIVVTAIQNFLVKKFCLTSQKPALKKLALVLS